VDFGGFGTEPDVDAGWTTTCRWVGPLAGADPGSMKTSSTVTDPADVNAPSSVAIDDVEREPFAGTGSDWNALTWRGCTGLGAREPATPGSATRARAAMSTDPTTNLLGRTIGVELYDEGHRSARHCRVRRVSGRR